MYNIHRILKLSLIILYIVMFIQNTYYMLLSIIAICIHELSHIAILVLQDIKKLDLKISIIGFKINLNDNKYIDKEIILYLSGSLCNLLIALICGIIIRFSKVQFVCNFMIVNIVIGIFNLMPAFPLDGAIILKNILFKKIKSNIVNLISILLSILIGIAIILIGSVIFLENYFIGIAYLIIGVLIFLSTYRQYKLFNNVSISRNIDYRKYDLIRKMYVKSEIICVSCEMKFLDIIKMCKFNKFLLFYFVDDDLNICGIMNEYNILECYKKFGNIKVREFYKK